MHPTIQISDEVYAAIQKDAVPLEDTADSVLRRWARQRGLIASNSAGVAESRIVYPRGRKRRHSPRRIDEFSFLGMTHRVSAWWEMYVKIAEILIQKHPERIGTLRSQAQVRESTDGVLAPRPIKGTKFWFASNLSAQATIDQTHFLLNAFGYDHKRELTIKDHVASRDAFS